MNVEKGKNCQKALVFFGKKTHINVNVQIFAHMSEKRMSVVLFRDGVDRVEHVFIAPTNQWYDIDEFVTKAKEYYQKTPHIAQQLLSKTTRDTFSSEKYPCVYDGYLFFVYATTWDIGTYTAIQVAVGRDDSRAIFSLYKKAKSAPPKSDKTLLKLKYQMKMKKWTRSYKRKVCRLNEKYTHK